MDEEQFRKHTNAFIQVKDRAEKKTLGQYFTPLNVRKCINGYLSEINFVPNTILEPSCGTGEFIIDMSNQYPKANIAGVELDKDTFSVLKKEIGKSKKIHLINDDFLTPQDSFKVSKTFDLIIGNPPYFFLKSEYADHKYFMRKGSSKTNIFELFIFDCCYLLNENGIIAFVLPKSIMTTVSFNFIREFICCNFDILQIFDHNDPLLFSEANQSVVSIVLRKKQENPFVLNHPLRPMFFSDNNIKTTLENAKKNPSLNDLGFTVMTGSVVWNQHKKALSDVKEGNIPLLYSKNIDCKNKTISFEIDDDDEDDGEYNEEPPKKKRKVVNEKKQFVNQQLIGDKYDVVSGPVIVVNRIVGLGGNIKSVFVQEANTRFYAENHINVIKHKTNDRDKLRKLQEYFETAECKYLVKTLISSTQLSKMELQYLLPVSL